MSPSPPQDAATEGKALDELEENGQAVVGEAEGGEYSILSFTSVSHLMTRLTHLSDAIDIFPVFL
jgi:hypothetical protein